MAISEHHAGRSYPPTAPYEVSAAKITEFATAIGDSNPAYRGADAVAPPTFAAVISSAAWDSMFDDPELGLALPRVVHADQRFSHQRPLRPGDRVTAALTIDRVRVRGSADMISSTVRVVDEHDELVCLATATFLHSHEGAPA
jgi:acyl dehydratase